MRWNLKKRGVILVLVLFLVSSTMHQVYSTSLGIDEIEMSQNSVCETDIPERYVIKDVPIVGQDTRFHCDIASHTMILNYYGFNVTKYEVFYLMGGGFSLLWHESNYLNLFPSRGCAYPPSNYEYVASILNLTFQPFYADLSVPENGAWDQVWTCIKENISRDQPVLVTVDSAILSVDQRGIKLPISLWRVIPLIVVHAVTVVGYDESTNSICYHDPQYSIFGDEDRGAYIWTDVDIFKTAFFRYSTHFPTAIHSTFRIKSHKRPEIISYDKDHSIEQAFQRNIKRLQGDYQFYTSSVDYPYNNTRNFIYGINASKKIHRILSDGLQTQLFTLAHYKRAGRLGFVNTFFFILDDVIQCVFEKDYSYIFDLSIPGYKNNYWIIAEEREVISEVLMQYLHLSPVFLHCAELLQNESDLWFEIASYHRLLLNKGVFLSIPRALWIFNQMAGIMEDIIHIQQEIISISS